MGDGRFTKNDPRRAKGGRPALADELRQRCLKAVDDKVLAYWIDEVTEREREIITPAGPMTMVCRGPHAAKCSELLAAYGLGKPVQPVESKVDVNITDARQMTTAQLDARIAELEHAEVRH